MGKRVLFYIISLILISVGVMEVAFYNEVKKLIPYYEQLTKNTAPKNENLQPKEQIHANYEGSQKCKECHKDEFKEWQGSLHSKMIQDAKKEGVIVGEFDSLPEDANFKKEDVLFTVGSKYKQRYMLASSMESKLDKYIFGNYQWNIELKKWQSYKPYKSWYIDGYEHNNEKFSSKTCDGCHFVGFMSKEERVEPAIGCESCHGAGSIHNRNGVEGNIHNAKLNDPNRATEICLQCHMRNRDKRLENKSLTEIFGDARDYPAGYEPGKPLVNYKLNAPFEHGKESGEFYGNGVAKKNRTQGNEFVNSSMYKHGVTCTNCHNPHELNNNSKKSEGNKLCLKCHDFGSVIGPHKKDLQTHTRHKVDSNGSLCIECHMPKVGRHTKKSPISVRTHRFDFIYPDETRKFGVPNGCNSCHNDKSLEWSEKYIKEWGMEKW